MFHLGAWTSNQAVTAVPIALTTIQDGFLNKPSTTTYSLPRAMRWLAGLGMGANIGAAQFQTPSLRPIAQPYLTPLNVGAAPVSLLPINYYGSNGPMLPVYDEFTIATTNGGGGAERQWGLAWFGDNLLNIPPGEILSVRATASITVGNLIWGQGTFAFSDILPNRRYAVVGMDIIGANLIAARLVFTNQGPKPGVLARQSTAVLPNMLFRGGNMGEFGRFDQPSPPSIELLGSAAPTTQEIIFDLMPL